jgi:hypothetical protein
LCCSCFGPVLGQHIGLSDTAAVAVVSTVAGELELEQQLDGSITCSVVDPHCIVVWRHLKQQQQQRTDSAGSAAVRSVGQCRCAAAEAAGHRQGPCSGLGPGCWRQCC